MIAGPSGKPSYRVLNGPHGGDAIQAPYAMPLGTACAVGFSGPKGLRYPVYVLTPDGLMFVRMHESPHAAQAHVTEINTVFAVAHEIEANGAHPDSQC